MNRKQKIVWIVYLVVFVLFVFVVPFSADKAIQGDSIKGGIIIALVALIPAFILHKVLKS